MRRGPGVVLALAMLASRAAAAPACLPDAAATDVTALEGDAHAIRVCFAAGACFAIDRRTSEIRALAARQQPVRRSAKTAAPIEVPDYASSALVFIRIGDESAIVKADKATFAGATGTVNHVAHAILATIAPRVRGGTRRFAVASMFSRTLAIIDPAADCDAAIWAGPLVLVTTDDCDGGNVRGALYDDNGKHVADVGGAQPLDTRDAFEIDDQAPAFVAPYAYALVAYDNQHPAQQTVVDLVPLQIQASASPRFAAIALDHDWLVASDSGGVGLVDAKAMTLARTWTIPRCAP